jgi:hypothetical protein
MCYNIITGVHMINIENILFLIVILAAVAVIAKSIVNFAGRLMGLSVSRKSKRANLKALNKILTERMEDPTKAGFQFEKFVKDMYLDNNMSAMSGFDFKDQGGYPDLLAKSKGDGGVDVIALDGNTIYVVQSKLYSSEVKKEVVSCLRDVCEMFQLKHPNKKIVPVLFAWSGVDNTAYAYAQHMGCQLYNEDSVRAFIA